MRNLSAGVFAVGAMADTVYGGNGDGLVSTADNAVTPFGQAWRVARAYHRIGSQDLVIGGTTTHAFYFRYLVPIWFDVQHLTYDDPAMVPSHAWVFQPKQ